MGKIRIQVVRGKHRWTREVARCELLSTQEAMAFLHFTRRHLQRLMKTELRPIRRSGHWYFRVKDLLLAQRRRAGQRRELIGKVSR